MILLVENGFEGVVILKISRFQEILHSRTNRIMDTSVLLRVLEATLHPDDRQAAEKKLEEVGSMS